MSLARAATLLEARDWQGAHPIVQDDESPLGCWAHGIVHTLEGDLGNARYWYRRAQRDFPGEQAVESEIAALKKAVEARGSSG
jgi:hypothetical protein